MPLGMLRCRWGGPRDSLAAPRRRCGPKGSMAEWRMIAGPLVGLLWIPLWYGAVRRHGGGEPFVALPDPSTSPV